MKNNEDKVYDLKDYIYSFHLNKTSLFIGTYQNLKVINILTNRVQELRSISATIFDIKIQSNIFMQSLDKIYVMDDINNIVKIFSMNFNIRYFKLFNDEIFILGDHQIQMMSSWYKKKKLMGNFSRVKEVIKFEEDYMIYSDLKIQSINFE